MIELKPVVESSVEYETIEKQIKLLLKKEIYLPLLVEFSSSAKVLKNSQIDDLLEAIQTGKLAFIRGTFVGKLNASLSKQLRDIGAKWDRTKQAYRLAQSDLPYQVKSAISMSVNRFIEKMKKIDQKLSEIIPKELASRLKIEHLFDRVLWKVDKEFTQSVKKITVAPQLTDFQRQRIADEWQNNMRLHIEGFAEAEIKRLRVQIQKNVFAGNRYESMIDTIQSSYKVSANKAKFLARNETNALMGKFKEVRYQEVGIVEYKWKCVKGTPDHQVRPRHIELNNESETGTGPTRGIFRFDAPPIAEADGVTRYNPSTRNNCRCRAVPVYRVKK